MRSNSRYPDNYFTEATIAERDEEKPDVILDYDDKGNVVSLEIMDVSLRVSVPNKVQYQVSTTAG